MHRWMALATLLMLLNVACSGQDDEPTATPENVWGAEPPTSTQAFVDRLDMAIDRDGTVYHATVTAAGTERGAQPVAFLRGELWVDAANERARRDLELGPPDTDATSNQTVVVDGNKAHTRIQADAPEVREGLPPLACPEVDVTVVLHQVISSFCASLVPQPDAGDELTAWIDADAEFEGAPAIALVYEARDATGSASTADSEGQPEVIAGRFYLSPDNWLPLGWTVEVLEEPTGAEVELTASYTYDFIPRKDLPDGFFDPANLDQPTEETP